ncbi:MAG: type I 3-dehydroquinate dehydratase [Lachnospiraceae bacterium]|nr:type I 3-dehydroquinate dehydratase [Lachnospiraceae bacterium]
MIEIRDVRIGEGKPKICVTIAGETEEAVRLEAVAAAESGADIIEWRADDFKDWKIETSVLRMLKIIRMCIGDKLFYFTFRTAEEGGHTNVKDSEYISIVKLAIDSRLIDLIDIECCVSEYRATELIAYAKNGRTPIIGSNHSFSKMLTIGELDFRIRYMWRLGVDAVKIGVVPNSRRDMYRLLNAAYDLTEDLDFPIAVYSMGEHGRFLLGASEFYGSAITFATLHPESGDGVDVRLLTSVINGMHALLN